MEFLRMAPIIAVVKSFSRDPKCKMLPFSSEFWQSKAVGYFRRFGCTGNRMLKFIVQTSSHFPR